MVLVETRNIEVSQKGRIGVVLLNMGGPIDLESVRPFLYELFADSDIINIPWPIKYFQKWIAWLVAKNRYKFTQKMYQQIGGGSPIAEITDTLAMKIKENLRETLEEAEVVVAMRYASPRAEEAIKKLISANVDTIILFSQYPHYAISTTGSSFKDFYKVFNSKYSELVDQIKFLEIEDWGEEVEYIDWWTKGIEETINKNKLTVDEDLHIIFTAHGLPQRYVNKGELYPNRIELAVDLVKTKLGEIGEKASIHLSYQSRAGPLPWVQPYTDDKIKEIASLNPSAVIMVPIGFVSNHVETLYEIDILYRDLAVKNQISNYYRVEVPDADDVWAKNSSNIILRKLEENK